MSDTNLVRLGHMLHAAREALRLVGQDGAGVALRDPVGRYALIYLIQVIGEAASNLSEEFRRHMPTVPWQAMIGMRHRPVHGYFQIRDDVLAETVRRDLPDLVAVLAPHVPAE